MTTKGNRRATELDWLNRADSMKAPAIHSDAQPLAEPAMLEMLPRSSVLPRCLLIGNGLIVLLALMLGTLLLCLGREAGFVMELAATDRPVEGQFLAAKLGGGGLLIILAALYSFRLAYREWGHQRSAVDALLKERGRSHHLLCNGSLGICILDQQWNVLEANPAFCTQLGYTPEQVIGLNIAALDAGHADGQLADVARRICGGKATFESRYRCRDGQLIEVEVCAEAIESHGEQLVLATVLDITERRRADAERRKLERALALLGDANKALQLANQEETLVLLICHLVVEKAGYQMAWVGYGEEFGEEAVRPVALSKCGHGCLEGTNIPWTDTELVRELASRVIETGQTHINHHLPAASQPERWQEVAGQSGYHSGIGLPLVSNGAVMGALAVYSTEARAFGPEEVQLLEKLAGILVFGIEALRARIDLAAANQELQAFTYAASHNLKAPLRGITAFSGLLETRYRDCLDGEGLMFLDQVRQGASRMSVLLDDLLAYSAGSDGFRRMQRVDVPDILNAIVAERQEKIRQCGADVRLSLPPMAVQANFTGLVQVLRNLLDNALQYAALATPPVIEIGGEVAGSRCCLWVKDNGIGFDMIYRERIFEIFRRLHTDEEYPGTGIGLAVAKRAMECMGGRIWAESTPGAGATFFLELQVVNELYGLEPSLAAA